MAGLSIADLSINVSVGGNAPQQLRMFDDELKVIGQHASSQMQLFDTSMSGAGRTTADAYRGMQIFGNSSEEAGKKAQEAGAKGEEGGKRSASGSSFAEKGAGRAQSSMMGLAMATMMAGDQAGPFSVAMNNVMNTAMGASMMTEGLGKKAFITGGILASIGMIGTAMSAQLQDAHAKLVSAVENTGTSYGEFDKRIQSVQHSAENLGFTQADYEGSLARVTIATKDTNLSIGYMGVVMDIARSQNESLTKAGEDFARIWAGAPMTLRRFGIETAKTVDPVKALDSAQKELDTSSQRVMKAQERVTELETNAAGAKKLGAAHALALKHAHEELASAQDKQGKAQDKVTKATADGANQNQAAELRVAELGKRIDGTASRQADTWGGMWRSMSAHVTDFVAHWGASLGPLLIGFGSLISAAGALGMSVTVAGLAIGGIVVFVLAAAAAAALLFVKWHEVMDFLGQASMPIKLLIGALVLLTSVFSLPIIAAVALARLIYDNFDSIKNFVVNAWHTIQDATTTAWNWVRNAVSTAMNAISNFIRPTLQAIQGWWREHGAQVMTVVTTLFNGIKAVVEAAMTIISTIIRVQWAIISTVISVAMNVIVPIVTAGWNMIVTIVTTVMNLMRDTVQTGWQLIMSVIQIAMSIIVGVITVALDLLTGQWGKAWDDIKAFAADVWNAIVSGAQTFVSNIINMFTNLATGLLDLGRQSFQNLWDGMKAIWSQLLDWISSIAGEVSNKFAELISAMYDIGKRIIESLADGIKAAAGHVVDAAKGVVSNAIDGAKNLLGIGSPSTVFIAIGEDTMQGFIDGLYSMVPDIQTAIDDITKGINDHFKQQLDIWPAMGAPDKAWNWWQTQMAEPFEAGGKTIDIGGGFGITGAPGGLQLVTNINQNIGGSVVTESDLVRLLRQELISIGRDNGNKVFGGGMFAPA